MTPPPEVVVARVPDALEESIDGETVVFAPGRSEMVVLDATATAVWEQARQPVGLTVLCERLAALYGEPVDRVARDLDGPIQQLIAAGVLVAEVGS